MAGDDRRRSDRDLFAQNLQLLLRGGAARVVDAFTNGELDVLVGTSLAAKGLDVPQVTLVGVVSADIALNLPDERAAERTYQLLAQAVGRSVRARLRNLSRSGKHDRKAQGSEFAELP